METLYTAYATATGGRNGHVKSDNGVLDLQVRFPKGLGGANDDYPNPEMLFACGYAACFDSALNVVIKQAGVKAGTTAVKSEVSIGKNDQGGFGLAVVLNVNIPGVSQEQADELTAKAHQICPYSNATRGNIDVTLHATTHE